MTSVNESDMSNGQRKKNDISVADQPILSSSPSQEATPPSAADEKQCRICLCEDDDPNSPLDRLFRPCQCKGTMAYVHGRCLDAWRRQSVKQSSMYKCDQCGYEYQMSNLGSPMALAVVRVVKTEWFRQLATVWLLLFVLYVVGVASRLYWGREEPAPDFLYSVLWDMCDGALFVGPISFFFSAIFWLAQWGGPAGFRGLGTGYRGLTSDKDCGKFFLLVIVVVGLAFAFRFLHGQLTKVVKYATTSTARHILDIRDVQPDIDLGDQADREWTRQVWAVLAAAALFLIVGSTAIVVATLLIVLWDRL